MSLEVVTSTGTQANVASTGTEKPTTTNQKEPQTMLDTTTTPRLTAEEMTAFISSYGVATLAKLTPKQMQKAITHWVAITRELDAIIAE